MKISGGTQPAIIPGREYRASFTGITRLVLCIQAVLHGCPNSIKACYDERIKNIIKGIPVRSPCYYRPGRASLVMIVHDLWYPVNI